VFLYFTSCIFIYGGELNAVIQKARVSALCEEAEPAEAGRIE
jgi:uncharacterized BrkB/YihY/UPF0761 family membrane protein